MDRTTGIGWASLLVLAACARAPAPASSSPSPATTTPVAVASVAPAVEPTPVATVPPAASAAPPVAKARCPDDMVDAAKVCIDRYEAPNKQGDKPLLMVDASESEAWCKQHGKRLCTEREWIGACGGEKSRPFPYGATHKDGACNDDAKYRLPSWAKLARWPDATAKAEAARLDQSEPSGQRATCVTPEGVHDMTANVAEWVVRTETHPENPVHVAMGCSWTKCFRPPRTPVCDYANYNHAAGWRSYEIGFRCCKDPSD